MTTSGTTAYDPSLGEIALIALSRCGIVGPTIDQNHMFMVRHEANLLLSEWSNRGINLWTIDLQSIALLNGVAAYIPPSDTFSLLDVYIDTTVGGTTYSRPIMPISRTDYSNIPIKSQQGVPTSYWYNRLDASQIYIWPVPDTGGPYTLKFYRMRQMQDAETAAGQTLDVPDRFIDAYVSGLASRLAVHFAPDRAVALDGIYEKRWAFASNSDTENVDIHISPNFSSYFR